MVLLHKCGLRYLLEQQETPEPTVRFQQWNLRTFVAKYTTDRYGRAREVFFDDARV
jgi:hypothetical protein